MDWWVTKGLEKCRIVHSGMKEHGEISSYEKKGVVQLILCLWLLCQMYCFTFSLPDTIPSPSGYAPMPCLIIIFILV